MPKTDNKMKTTVTIEWDKPQEQAWLCPENIAIALHAHCKNTEFKVTESLSQPTDAKVRDKIENYVDCQIIHGNIDKSEFSWLYAVCEHWFSEGRVNARAFNQESQPTDAIFEKVKALVDKYGIEELESWMKFDEDRDKHDTIPEVTDYKRAFNQEAIPDRQPSPSGGDAIEFGEWIHEQGYEPWGVTGLWHNIANRKIIPDKIFTTEQLYQQFKETTSNKVTKGDK